MSNFSFAKHVFTCLAVTIIAGTCFAQTDPGPRGGTAGAGGYFPSLGGPEQAVFDAGKDAFGEIDSVSGTIEGGKGLGPTFNGNSCAQCHAEPAVGGTSPGIKSKINPGVPNPQVALATLDGAHNTVPSFITANGPVREARFVRNANGTPDGGVHGLYTIAGRIDAAGCTLAQPNFAQQLANNNVVFRIPTPTFGLGLVENTPDANLQANLAANGLTKALLGISGRLNTTGNDGTVTRFGWKAQNKSLMIFAGEAYNVEQGVSNENFTNERSATPGCVYNSSPEDFTGVSSGTPVASDLALFALFMRLSAPPTPTTANASEINGRNLFNSVGCALCHSPNLTTGGSQYTGMSNITYHPYSDFAVHNMGTGLADGVSQGAAAGNEFRSAPLWGVGQRLFFLHDGRTADLLQAIQAHSSSGSEANSVIGLFNLLSSSAKQDILNFLRSL